MTPDANTPRTSAGNDEASSRVDVPMVEPVPEPMVAVSEPMVAQKQEGALHEIKELSLTQLTDKFLGSGVDEKQTDGLPVPVAVVDLCGPEAEAADAHIENFRTASKVGFASRGDPLSNQFNRCADGFLDAKYKICKTQKEKADFRKRWAEEKLRTLTTVKVHKEEESHLDKNIGKYLSLGALCWERGMRGVDASLDALAKTQAMTYVIRCRKMAGDWVRKHPIDGAEEFYFLSTEHEHTFAESWLRYTRAVNDELEDINWEDESSVHDAFKQGRADKQTDLGTGASSSSVAMLTPFASPPVVNPPVAASSDAVVLPKHFVPTPHTLFLAKDDPQQKLPPPPAPTPPEPTTTTPAPPAGKKLKTTPTPPEEMPEKNVAATGAGGGGDDKDKTSLDLAMKGATKTRAKWESVVNKVALVIGMIDANDENWKWITPTLRSSMLVPLTSARKLLDGKMDDFARQFFTTDPKTLRRTMQGSQLEAKCKTLVLGLESHIQSVKKEVEMLVRMTEARSVKRDVDVGVESEASSSKRRKGASGKPSSKAAATKP